MNYSQIFEKPSVFFVDVVDFVVDFVVDVVDFVDDDDVVVVVVVVVVVGVFVLFLRFVFEKWKPLKSHFQKNIIPYRFVSLIIGGLFGLALLLLFIHYLKECFFMLFDISIDNIDEHTYFINSVQLLLLGLPVFILLWVFRTRDIKTQIEKSSEQIKKSQKQIEKSQTQMNQASYFKGVDNLASNNFLKINIGVRLLVELRKFTPEYDEGIAISFEKFFKSRAYTTKIDFSEIYLSKANLVEANLRDVKLERAYLSKADLSKAKLVEAKLTGADLIGANLREAQLTGANLSGANLSGADLSGADFFRADLSGAYLSGADLSKADLRGADLSNANLSDADFQFVKFSENTKFEDVFYYKSNPPQEFDFKKLGYKLKSERLHGKPIRRIKKQIIKHIIKKIKNRWTTNKQNKKTDNRIENE